MSVPFTLRPSVQTATHSSVKAESSSTTHCPLCSRCCPGLDRRRQDIRDELHQPKRQTSLCYSSNCFSLCVAEHFSPKQTPQKVCLLFSVCLIVFPFYLILSHFFYHHFCRFSKIRFQRWGRQQQTPVGKHVSVRIRFWKPAWLYLTMRKSKIKLKACFIVFLRLGIWETVKHWKRIQAAGGLLCLLSLSSNYFLVYL